MTKREAEVDMEAFLALDIRAGIVLSAEPFPEARKPAIKLRVDFGPIGILASSARLTAHYSAEALIGTRVLGIVNLPPLRVAGFRSECLILGLVHPDDAGDVVLIRPDPTLDAIDTKGWRLG